MRISDWSSDVCSSDLGVGLAAIKPDWLVIDHYAIDHSWERALRPFAERLMAVDDLADRMHDCDMLLDQNFYTDMAGRYVNLVSSDCRLLLGPLNVLLRKELDRQSVV